MTLEPVQFFLSERGSSASQMTAAKIMDVIARLPGCYGQAADAVSAYTRALDGAPKLLKIPKSECPDGWIRLPRHKWPDSWVNIEDTWYILNETCLGTISWTLVGKTSRRSFIRHCMGESTELGMYVRSSKTKVISVRKCG